jgi:hypothetical protein
MSPTAGKAQPAPVRPRTVRPQRSSSTAETTDE